MLGAEGCVFGLYSRRRAREGAVQALYYLDTLGERSFELIPSFFDHFYPKSTQRGVNHRGFAEATVRGVLQELLTIDDAINIASVHWRLERMCRVDRNILRVGSFEILFRPEVPASVAINEAIEIAKRFGTPESPNFVNGVLDNVAKGTPVHEGKIRRSG